MSPKGAEIGEVAKYPCQCETRAVRSGPGWVGGSQAKPGETRAGMSSGQGHNMPRRAKQRPIAPAAMATLYGGSAWGVNAGRSGGSARRRTRTVLPQFHPRWGSGASPRFRECLNISNLERDMCQILSYARRCRKEQSASRQRVQQAPCHKPVAVQGCHAMRFSQASIPRFLHWPLRRPSQEACLSPFKVLRARRIATG